MRKGRADVMTVGISERMVGARVKRSEDPRLLTGRGRYVDDVHLPGMLHAAFLRSPLAHARITRIDASAARELPGVVAVYTGADMRAWVAPATSGGKAFGLGVPGYKVPPFRVIADEKVRFVGDPVAIVVAESRAVAEDACERIDVEYDPLPPVVTAERALDAASPAVFDEIGSNVAFQMQYTFGDVDGVFAAADRTIRETFRQHRHQNVPMEGRGSVASYDPAKKVLTIHSATQGVFSVQRIVAPLLGLEPESVHVLAGDVGGSFGLKIGGSREEVAVCAASKQLGRPVKWVEDRNENLTAAGQAREETVEIEAAVTSDGMVLGFKVKLLQDQGSYPAMIMPAAGVTFGMMQFLPGPYRLGALSFEATSVTTNKCQYVAYRGPWAVETWVRERMLDVIARELGMDPIELRRKNLAVRGEPPTHMVTGLSLAGITSRESLDRAVALVDYAGFRERQRKAREEGRFLGIGFATYIEAAPGPRSKGGPPAFGAQDARLRLEPDGRVTVFTMQQPHGQGHETTLAQIAADEMGVPFEQVTVVYGDTKTTPFGMGTGGSRSATLAGGAVLHGARALKRKALAFAGALIETKPEDLEIRAGRVFVRDAPERSISLAEVAAAAASGRPANLPADVDRNLEVVHHYDGGGGGWSGGTHCCLVEVDIETGCVRIDRYVVIEDCGVVINPAVVDGQIRGGVAQGIGAVLLERSAYDEDGQYLSGSLMDYLLPTTTDVPPIEIEH
ncbi:MAG TPA: xanthine dehydrogenase family protein molybdopterin-binding subunit, partial [Thermoanaerobaculia bacterium]|nr:xanthine dehydrogenase family protein molybdopterin-binding subunit [Thermoanaerobaculia bacterium]